MADNKKYYYLKLKEDFYESEELKILQAMPDGFLYSDILLKLYLKSLKEDGRLMYKGIIPYTSGVIATLTGHQVGTVEKAIELFKQLQLIDILDNGAIYMLDIQNFIGQSNTEADRKRDYRRRVESEKSKDNLPNGTNVRELSRECPLENRDKSIDIRDKSIDIRDKSIDIRDKSIENKINNKNINNNINTEFNNKHSKNNKQSKNNIGISSERLNHSEPAAEVASIFLNDGSEFLISLDFYQELENLYPSVDVKQEFNEMRAWSLSNPTRRKTIRGIKRFINTWLSREQDKGRSRQSTGKKQSSMEYFIRGATNDRDGSFKTSSSDNGGIYDI